MTNIFKTQRLVLGPGAINDGSQSITVYAETTAPTALDGAEGDVWIWKTSPAKIYQKTNGAWVDVAQNLTVATQALVDGQLVAATALQYSSVQYPYAVVNYTVRRGSGHARKRHGNIVILADSGSNTFIDSETSESFGADVNVPFTVSMAAGIVTVSYTSTLEGVTIEMKSTVNGF